MKKNLTLLCFSLLSPLYCVSGDAATVIKTLPFSITQPGSYVLGKNLRVDSSDAAVFNAITVNASSVLIDLKGFSLTCTSNDGNSDITGIYVPSTSSNVTIQNGTIFTFDTILNFSAGLQLYGPEATVQNLGLEHVSGYGIFAVEITSCIIQNCLIVGSGGNLGIELRSCSDVVVKNNQIVNEPSGIGSSNAGGGGNNWFISNYVGNCTYGLGLSPNDKYQGNVTVLCTTPFSGGIAVGTANN